MLMSTQLSRRLAYLYAILVIAVSSLPSARLPDLGGARIDKLLHFTQYAVLGYLVARGWGPGRFSGDHGRWGRWLPAVILLIFAAVDEYHQHWIPGRAMEFWDWIADGLGVIASYSLGIRANRRARELRGDPPPSARVSPPT